MKKILNNEGVTIPVVLIALVLTSILGFTILFMVDNQTKLNSVDKQSKLALEYAEAGYNKYLWHLNDDVEFYLTYASKDMMNKDIPFQDGFYRLEVVKPEFKNRFLIIKSTGWTEENPDIKKTIIAKVRKKQFVHHVCVSDSEYIIKQNFWGNKYKDYIYWKTDDEAFGPYHSNDVIAIDGDPKFYDEVTYVERFHIKSGNPKYLLKAKEGFENLEIPKQVTKLEFPDTNSDLKIWAKKDKMLFKGRTCIYLEGKNIKIRNGNDNKEKIMNIPVDSIKNKVIYVEKEAGGGTGKFDIKAGNIFISGKLEGELTIGAENNIYITYDDPTNWYDYDEDDIYNNIKPKQPPKIHQWKDSGSYNYPESGGIKYSNTTFLQSSDKLTRTAKGDDMLGLVANNNIFILHYGWLKRALEPDLSDNYWNFEWKWSNYYNRWIKINKIYDVAPENITVHAALFAVKGGFIYEGYDKGGNRGDIVLWGNITQKIRKPVGLVNGTGYNKKYAHDPRMFYDYPPHILEPTNVGWEVHDWREINDHVEINNKGDD